MRASTLLNALLDLAGVWVGKAAVCGDELRVMVSLRRRRLECPQCLFTTRHRYDTREVGCPGLDGEPDTTTQCPAGACPD